jgi:outer membrane protein assembly factor BamB
VSILRRSPAAAGVALLALCLSAAWLLAGCSTTPKNELPTPLAKKMFNRVAIHRVWHTRLSGEAPKLRLGLELAVDGGRLFAASHSGFVEAFDVTSGRRLWRQRVRAPLSGGPGVGHGLVLVGSSKGDVIALAEADGTLRWHRHLNAEILSAPVVGSDLVVVRGVDGRLAGLAAADGAESWVVDQQVPRLSLRGVSRPVLAGDLAVCGFDDGHVVAVVRTTGAVAWNTAVDEPHGNGELQRLIDVDAPVVASGQDLFAVAYQGHVARITRETGQIVWKHEWSSYRGLAVDGDAVYVSSADGVLGRMDRNNGAVQWQQNALARRELSAPVVFGGRVVVGDLAGYVHWFDAATGAYLSRAQAGKRRVSAAPLVVGDLLVASTDGGDLSAFRASSTTLPAPPPPKVKPSKARKRPPARKGAPASKPAQPQSQSGST